MTDAICGASGSVWVSGDLRDIAIQTEKAETVSDRGSGGGSVHGGLSLPTAPFLGP